MGLHTTYRWNVSKIKKSHQNISWKVLSSCIKIQVDTTFIFLSWYWGKCEKCWQTEGQHQYKISELLNTTLMFLVLSFKTLYSLSHISYLLFFSLVICSVAFLFFFLWCIATALSSDRLSTFRCPLFMLKSGGDPRPLSMETLGDQVETKHSYHYHSSTIWHSGILYFKQQWPQPIFKKTILLALMQVCQFFFLSVRLLSVLRGHPRHNGQWPPTSKDF